MQSRLTIEFLCMRLLPGNSRNFRTSLDTYAVFSVQEEVGLRGAKVAAHRVQGGDYAINLDTTIAFDVDHNLRK